MASSSTKTLVYDDWSAGEFGTIDPTRAPEGSWTGTNVIVYEGGHIGPRPGLRKAPVTNLPEAGPIMGFGFSPVGGSGDATHWIIIDDDVFVFDPMGDTFEADGDLDSPPAVYVQGKESLRQIFNFSYFVTDTGVYQVYIISHEV